MPAGLTHPLALAGVALLALTLGAAAQQRAADETALRFYAAQGQLKRVEKEAQRLAAQHPGWTMPEDIWTARPGQADEKPLWALFSADDIEGLKRAIAERRRSEPGWRPSDDLARKLRRKELRKSVLAKAGSAQWLTVADLAGDFGKGGDVDDVELAWAVAEGLARSDRQPEAFALYGAILTRRSDPKERSATIQKAIGLLPMADVELLLAMGKTDASGAPEFAALSLDVTRGRISAILHDERKTALDPAEMAAFEAQARGSDNADEAGLIAWLALKQNRPADALGWFKLAIARGGDAMVAHGLAHTLLRLGKRREAEEVAFAWREPLVNNAILFIDVLEGDLTQPNPPAIEPERLSRYARVTLDTRSGEGAQALGWYAYNACQFETALDWFRRASAWLPKEATVYGQALSLQRLKRSKEFSELVNRYDGLFPKVVALALPDRNELPGPCDAQVAARTAAFDGGRQNLATALRVPQPATNTAPDATLTMRRAGFPAAVSPENPLRFPEIARSAEPLRPRAAEARPLVARRVGGVTAMPYEPLGFALLPGWNGQAGPGDIAAGERPPARGTLWAETATQSQGAASGVPERETLPIEAAANRFRR
jgi:tetratricopeptide (TPR) repeat protein